MTLSERSSDDLTKSYSHRALADWVVKAEDEVERMGRMAELRDEHNQALVTGNEALRAEVERLRNALQAAVDAARVFNRSGMSWLEYDAMLVRLEREARDG